MIEGQRVDRYKLEKCIHEGDAASVYRARHLVLDSLYALKIENREAPPEMREALVLEAKAQAAIRHPNVVRVTDAFDFERRVVVVTEYHPAESLADLMDRRTAPFPVKTALVMFRGIVRGVRALHTNNIVHRDLKPENILLAVEGRRGTPLVADFGLAKRMVPGQAPTPTGLSSNFSYMGTPEYMAPEQARDPGRVDERADMFGLGCLLYELLTDTVCFEAERPVDAMYKAAKGDYKRLSEANPHVHEALDGIVNDLLQRKVDLRLQSCDLLLKRLDGV